MQTTSVAVQTLCIPCACHCRYCLLSWNGKTCGADFERSRAYAEQFHAWMKENHPDWSFHFFFGYCMEHPELPNVIDFMRKIGSTTGEFLQLNGLKMRDSSEIEAFLTGVKMRGVRLIDLTFYGLRDSHDRFAGRKGDFDYLLNILSCANRIGLDVEVGIPLTKESVGEIDELLSTLGSYTISNLFLFVPHAEGRGETLNSVRFTLSDYERLSENARRYFKRSRYKTEWEWLSEEKFPEYEKRQLTLSLTPENIEHFENQPFEETIAELECLDDTYHAAMPEVEELARLYGDCENDAFYNWRDLLMRWQKQHIAANQLKLYDIHDERQCFVRRF